MKIESIISTLVLLALAACASAEKTSTVSTAANANAVEREPAAASAPAPDLKNTKWRVVRSANLKPLKVGGQGSIYISHGHVLSEAQVKDLREAKEPQVQDYCVLYTDKRLRLASGQSLEVGVAMPPQAHWEPGHIYALRSAQLPSLKGFGCFALSVDARERITEQDIRGHFQGIVELER